MLLFHFASLTVILLSRNVLLHLHFVVHLSHLRAHLKVVMLDQQWQACASAFLRACSPSGSEHTVATYRRVLVHFFRDRDPQKVTRRDVEDFLHAPINPHRAYGASPSPATRNTRLAVLHSFYKYAATFAVPSAGGPPMPLFRGVAPTAGVRLAKVPHRYRVFSQSDLERLFAVIPEDTVRGARDRCIYAFYYLSGRRRSELCNLVFGDIFEGIVTNPDGTYRHAWLYKFRRKGGIEDTAEMPGLVKKLLDRYLTMSGRIDTIAPDDGLFLPLGAPHGGLPLDPFRPMSGQGIWYNLKVYCRKAGLDPNNFTVHSLRHGSARARYLLNPDIRAIQQVLRHESIRTTEIYVHELIPLGDPALKSLEEKFEHLF